MTQGKKYRASAAKVDRTKLYELPQAMALVKATATAKFNETVEVAVRLGVDPKHADQMVRGTVVLPHGTGSTVRVAVVASGEKIKEAEEAGADIAGGDELVARIQAGFLDFEALVATPDMMKSLGRLGGPGPAADAQPEGGHGDLQPQDVKELKRQDEFRVDDRVIHAAGQGLVRRDPAH
jgi:large subunit ribosomal protein L1